MKRTFVILGLAFFAATNLPARQRSIPLYWYTVTPCRWMDTRTRECIPGSRWDLWEPCAVGPYRSGETRFFLTQGGAECPMNSETRPIPVWTQAVVLNVSATGQTHPGYLIVYNPLNPAPPIETLRFQPGITKSQLAIVSLGQELGYQPGQEILPDLAISAHVEGQGTVEVIVDIAGYMMWW